MDWQVESGLRTAAFISATSEDLGDCRTRTSKILLEAGILPVAQDYFGSDPRSIERLLVDKILAADAVVCLVGHAFGASPKVDALPSSRSYTQLEHDYASRYEKPVFLFVATDAFAASHPVNESPLLRDNQQRYRDEIQSGPRKYQLFSSVDELERLIHALIRPILAHADRRSILYLDSPSVPACFVGRGDEIAELNFALDSRVPAVIALLGMGGQGKTALLAHSLRRRDALPFAAGIWVSAERGSFTFSEFLDHALSTFMGKRFDKSEVPGLDARIQLLLSLMQARPLLIVIDAIERWLVGWVEHREIIGLADLSLRHGAQEGLDHFLRQATALENGSHLVLTSRALPSALDTASCAILPILPSGQSRSGLQSLSPDEAVELLERLGMVAPRERLLSLAEQLVRHPLALTGFARVARRLGSKWEPRLSGKDNDPSKAFHALMDEIRKHLPHNQMAEPILQFAALLPEGAHIELLTWLLRTMPENILAPQAVDVLAIVIALDDWNLVMWDAAAQTVSLHALISEYFLETVAQDSRASTDSRAAGWYASQPRSGADGLTNGVLSVRHYISAGAHDRAFRVMFEDSPESPSLISRLLDSGHLWECAELLESLAPVTSGMPKIRCFLSRARILIDLELPQRALADLEFAANIIRNIEGTWAPLRDMEAQYHHLRGVISLESGRASEAIEHFNLARQIFARLGVGSDVPNLDLPETIANLGLSLWHTGDWNGAERAYREAQEALSAPEFARLPGADLLMIDQRGRLASLAMDRGNPASAVTTLQGILADFGKTISVQSVPLRSRLHRNIYLTESALVYAYLASGSLGQALELARGLVARVENLVREGRSERNGDLAQVRAGEAAALLQLGDGEQALFAADDSIHLYQYMLEKGASHLEGQLANAMFRRAQARYLCNNAADAILDVQRAIQISREWLRNWVGECDIQSVFLGNALSILPCIGAEGAAEKAQIFELLNDCVERITRPGSRSAADLRDAVLLCDNWQKLRVLSAGATVEWASTPPQALSLLSSGS